MILSTPRGLAWLALALALVPSNAGAQTVLFPELSGHIEPGDTVSLTDVGGQRIKGKVADLTASSLTLLRNNERRTFPEASVRSIVVRDSVRNGALIGLAAGAVPGAILGFVLNMACDNEGSSCPGAAFGVGAFFGGVGAAIGAGIDGLIHKTVYVSRQQAAGLTLSPVIDTDRQGILVSIRF